MRTLTLSLISLLVVGCSSASPDKCDDNAVLDPDCHHGSFLPNGSSGTGGENTGGSENGGAGTGGDCVASVTCESVNAECGTISDDGCGREVECPNNCTGSNICGGGGEQFKCGCTPKTVCDADECGVIGDGCGGNLDCGEKACQGSYRIAECGADSKNPDGGTSPGVPNQCGDICVKLPYSQFNMCSGYPMYNQTWSCYEAQTEFFQGCWNTIEGGEGMPSAVWCCPPFD